MEEKRKGGKEERRERGREAKTGVREEKHCNGGKERASAPDRAGGGGREEGVKESGYEGWEGCMIGVQSEHHGCPKPHPLF